MKRDELELVVTHLDMALYGYQATAQSELGAQFGHNIPYLYHMFASGTLLTALFLTREKTDSEFMGGYVHRVLNKHGLQELLVPIGAILSTKIGRTTFGDIIRLNRNKLMVHGELDQQSLPEEVAEVPFDDNLMSDFEELMEEFVEELKVLRRELFRRIDEAG